MGRTTHEVPSLGEARGHPDGGGVAPVGEANARHARDPKQHLLRLVRPARDEGGLDALADQPPRPRSVWNRIPDEVRRDVVEFALEHEDLTARELAVRYTDEKRYFVSESSAYRILKAEDLIAAPAHVVIRGEG